MSECLDQQLNLNNNVIENIITSMSLDEMKKYLGDIFHKSVLSITVQTDTYFNRSLSKVINDIINIYTDKNRTYHNLEHIVTMLKTAELLPEIQKLEPVNKAMLNLAIIYHDAVYVTGLNYAINEPLSAYKFMQDASLLGLETIDQKTVYIMILTTWYSINFKPLDLLSKYLVDLDFFASSFSYSYFMNMSKNIKLECKNLIQQMDFDEKIFMQNRINFISDIIKKERIFQTDLFFNEFEAKAKENFSKELVELNQEYLDKFGDLQFLKLNMDKEEEFQPC